MTTKLTPDMFEYDLLRDANQQIQRAIEISGSFDLDRRTSFWVIRKSAWIELLRSADFAAPVCFGFKGPKQLMGLSVRITCDDDPGIPMILLVMGPKMYMPARRGA